MSVIEECFVHNTL